MKAAILVNCDCILGEGPLWHSKRKTLFWVDIEGCCFYEYDLNNKKISKHEFDKRLSVITETADENTVVIGLQGKIIKYNLNTKEQIICTEIENAISSNRTNDGKIDCEGRLWIGTMDVDLKDKCGSLYMLNNNFQLETKLSSVSISNGIAWNADNTIMYFIDSPTKKVDAYNFDAGTGKILFSKTVIRIPSHLGDPDGMCIDSEGKLWIAQWGGKGVYRWDPITGKLLSRIDVPCPHVTSCCFGGDNYETLFITTAKQKLTRTQLENFPLSGGTFCANPGTHGFASNYLQ